jgi:hypothetical protein
MSVTRQGRVHPSREQDWGERGETTQVVQQNQLGIVEKYRAAGEWCYLTNGGHTTDWA